MNTAAEVENYIYRSYMRALPYLSEPHKRNPQFTRVILNQIGNPDATQYNILVTGSKGKGSVSRILSKLLEGQGYKVGLFTSPHLVKFNERIRINGIAISDEALIKYTNFLKPIIDEIESQLSQETYIGPVGIAAIIASLYFRDHSTDMNVIELGKGARFDDVNQLESNIAVINKVFEEHIPDLGNNLKEIAYNKAGVIKKGQKFVFSTAQSEEVMEEIEKEANANNVTLKSYGNDFVCENIVSTLQGTQFDLVLGDMHYKDLNISLLGRHQAYNAALAIGVLKEIVNDFNINKVSNSLSTIKWPGRLEVVGDAPLMILDGCINRDSAKYVKELIHQFKKKKMITIIGIPDDKDYLGVIDEINDISSQIILTRTKNQYLKFTDKQLEAVKKMGVKEVSFCDSIGEAIHTATNAITGEDIMICILGTQSLIRDTKEFLGQDTLNLV